MDIDDRAAAVQFVQDRRERGVTQPFAGVARQQADAVGAQGVQRMGDLGQAGVDLGQGQAGEQAEAAGMVAHHGGAEFVARAGGFRRAAGFIASKAGAVNEVIAV